MNLEGNRGGRGGGEEEEGKREGGKERKKERKKEREGKKKKKGGGGEAVVCVGACDCECTLDRSTVFSRPVWDTQITCDTFFNVYLAASAWVAGDSEWHGSNVWAAREGQCSTAVLPTREGGTWPRWRPNTTTARGTPHALRAGGRDSMVPRDLCILQELVRDDGANVGEAEERVIRKYRGNPERPEREKGKAWANAEQAHAVPTAHPIGPHAPVSMPASTH